MPTYTYSHAPQLTKFLMSEPSEQYCRALLSSGQQCDCEEFMSPLDESAAWHCRECSHGHSKHKHLPSSAPSQSQPSERVETNLGKQQGNGRIASLIRLKTGRTTSGNMLSKAREEAMVGFRPLPIGRVRASQSIKVTSSIPLQFLYALLITLLEWY